MDTFEPAASPAPRLLIFRQLFRRRRLAQFAAEVQRCEYMLTQAAGAAVEIDAADASIVRDAQCALLRRPMCRESQIALLAAKERISRALFYPSAQVFKDLQSADELQSHVALAGSRVLPDESEALAQARAARSARRWNTEVEARFYVALNKLSNCALPVVAATAGRNALVGSRRAIRMYTIAAISLTVVVVALSCLMFTVNRISDDVMKIVQTNDASAMQLHNQLMSYASSIIETRQKQDLEMLKLRHAGHTDDSLISENDEILIGARQRATNELRALSNSQPALQIKEQLQQFATNNRQLYNDVTRTQGIGDLLFLTVKNPYTEPDCRRTPLRTERSPGDAAKEDDRRLAIDWTCSKAKVRANLEIKVPIMQADHVTNDHNEALPAEEAVAEGFQKIAAYQDIRAMAMYGREIVLSLVGAVTGFVLPVLYAWLGACAAILRKIRTESETSTFHPEYSTVANRSHVTCAVIVGIAIGLFSDLVQGGKSISPLAVAFIAGYASDKFFVFIDQLVDVLFPNRPLGKLADKKTAREVHKPAVELPA
ncbi:hypothetical protein AWB78_08099 [Caballeronia calidae]|uniref:Uncharacterized protein n=2 Tax=Caballeronia calidae TaxID=1777139 RepID=A0A158EII2_9BURK|nr:hypothetical protein AWB78_08099 [Caballeronia calidae]